MTRSICLRQQHDQTDLLKATVNMTKSIIEVDSQHDQVDVLKSVSTWKLMSAPLSAVSKCMLTGDGCWLI